MHLLVPVHAFHGWFVTHSHIKSYQATSSLDMLGEETSMQDPWGPMRLVGVEDWQC